MAVRKQVNSNVKQRQWLEKRSSHSGVTEVFSNRLLLFDTQTHSLMNSFTWKISSLLTVLQSVEAA